LESGLENLESVVNMARRQNLNSQVKNITVEQSEADAFLAEQLNIPIGTRITSICRKIVVDDIPVSYHEDFVPAKFLAPDQVDGLFAGSVLDLIGQQHSPAITCADTEITTSIAEKTLAALLQVPVHMALILLKESLYDEDRTVVDYSRNYFIPDRFRIRVLRRKNLDFSIGGG
jgi:DNA-binding GntR family transcriptional regulator